MKYGVNFVVSADAILFNFQRRLNPEMILLACQHERKMLGYMLRIIDTHHYILPHVNEV